MNEVNLFLIVNSSKKFSLQLVREVIANIPENFRDVSSSDYGSPMVRRKEVFFSHESINAFYDNIQ